MTNFSCTPPTWPSRRTSKPSPQLSACRLATKRSDVAALHCAAHVYFHFLPNRKYGLYLYLQCRCVDNSMFDNHFTCRRVDVLAQLIHYLRSSAPISEKSATVVNSLRRSERSVSRLFRMRTSSAMTITSSKNLSTALRSPAMISSASW